MSPLEWHSLIDSKLPVWTRGLTTRTKNGLVYAFEGKEQSLLALKPADLRRFDYEGWMRSTPNVGRLCVRELQRLVDLFERRNFWPERQRP